MLTEGWNVSNRGWLATVTFATLGTHHIRIFDEVYKSELTSAKSGQMVTIELNAALNQDWNKADKGWVEITTDKGELNKVEVVETGMNTGIFTAKYLLPKNAKNIKVSYGYLGFDANAILSIK
ncbi:MAG: hypothetical protein HC830_08575 [Bacteroidetes bacterium]|nr:hypothetical protein [Bacteroidota bacterium]